MRAAIVVAPYHTNGGYPTLGAAYLNAVLRSEGVATDVYDLQFAVASEDPGLFFELKRNHNIGRNLHVVQSILDLRFALTCLWGDSYPDFAWELSNDLCPDTPLHPAERDRRVRVYTALAMRLREFATHHAAAIAERKPAVALFSTYVPNVLLSLLIAQRLKRLLPTISILFGGPGAALPEAQRFILESGLADGIALRDGEPIVREIARRSGAQDRVELNVPGVVTDASKPAPPLAELPDLDSLLLPDFEGFPLPNTPFADYQRNWNNEYRSKCFDSFMLPVQTSRGCSMRCAFCSESVLWTRFNARSPRTIIDEIRAQQQRYGRRCFSFNSSLVNHDEAWHKQFLDELCAAQLDIHWWGYYRPTRDLSPATVELMRRSGCKMVSMGVESFSQTALSAMSKGTESGDALESVIALVEAGIFVDFALLTGFPVKGHNQQTEYDENIRHLRRLKDRIGVGRCLDITVGHLVRVEACSRLCAQPEQFGISKTPDPIGLPEQLRKLAPAVARMSSVWSGEVSHEEKQTYANRLALFVERVFSTPVG